MQLMTAFCSWRILRASSSGLVVSLDAVLLAAGLCLGVVLRAQPRSEPPVVLPKMDVTASVPLVKVADYKMREARIDPAVVAQGDFIYIIGGSDSDRGLLTSVERFDVRTNKSELFTQLKIGRKGHRAVLVGNSIYVLGGRTDRAVGPEAAVEAQHGQTTDIRGVNVAGPDSSNLEGDADVHSMVAAADAALSRGEAQTMGLPTVDSSAGRLDDSVEVVDLATRTVTRATDMPDPRCAFACVLRDGKIYVIGGQHPYRHTLSTARTNSTLILDLASGQWSRGVPMPTPRESDGVLVDGGFIVVPGGYDGLKQHAEMEVFNPTDGIWRTLPPLCKPVSAQSLVFLDHYLFLFGDYNSPGELITYNLVDRQSEVFTLQYKPARHTGAVTLDGKIYVIGGTSLGGGNALDYIQVYALRKKK